MKRTQIAILACAVLLYGCGGGGGGGGGQNNNAFTIRLDRTSVSFDYVQNKQTAPAVVTATWTGQPPDPLFIGAVLQGTGLNPVIPITITQTYANIELSPLQLNEGQYSGQVQLLACTDAACANRVGGTPLTVSYTINVRAPVFSGPGFIQLSHLRGTPPPAGTSLQINAAAGAWTATATQPWITLSQTSGSGAAFSGGTNRPSASRCRSRSARACSARTASAASTLERISA